MRRFFLVNDAVRMRAAEAIDKAPQGWTVTLNEPRRNNDQNAAMWPILEAFSQQLQWPVNGQMVSLEPEEWKDILSAAFEGESRIAQGLNGGFVFLGKRTREFNKQRFSEWLDFLHSVAAERGVEI